LSLWREWVRWLDAVAQVESAADPLGAAPARLDEQWM
jgi:hypothetical protein